MAAPHSSQQTEQPKNRTVTAQPSLLARLLMLVVKFYRYFISPMMAPRCRFNPTCSRYALDAIQIHGAFKGSWLALKRIAKCHPLHEGGDDPVPPCKKS